MAYITFLDCKENGKCQVLEYDLDYLHMDKEDFEKYAEQEFGYLRYKIRYA